MFQWLPRLVGVSGTILPDSTTTAPATRSSSSSGSAAAAWFLGPKAENAEHLKKYIDIILKDLVDFRRNFCPEDNDFIKQETKASSSFKESMSRLDTNLTFLSSFLPQHSVPLFSPRYMAHMINEVSMPATLGYLLGLMYNPNNVAVEASLLTSIIEFDVGQQLCGMLGFNVAASTAAVEEESSSALAAWGHITADGSIANTESMWVARNLKFYPLSLRRAVDNEPCLAALASHFLVTLCTGREQLLSECDSWDLLNLSPEEVVSLPGRITAEFGISPQALQAVLSPYNIQTTGKDDLERYFGIQQTPQYFLSKTAHYSWPKGAALTGIGSQNLIGVPVDRFARLDAEALDASLADCLKRRRPVYAVLAIMGTTEHGTLDPLSKILALRRKYQRRGLSFLVHADAAWGGYFMSMFVPNPATLQQRRGAGGESGIVPLRDDAAVFVNPYTERELRQLRFADTVTVDPHKSGYVPYPAGSLCYRDGRLRYLVTWTSPVIDSLEDGATRMGVYGIEGSKPGAAAVAAWMGHEVIGLHKGGYGLLLSEAIFAGIKMYCHWATMSLDHPNLLIQPFRMLPSEQQPNATAKEINSEKRYIRDFILTRTRQELASDPKTRMLMQQLGSDLVVNPFACNFLVDGQLNKDVAEANLLNARIYERLSFHKLTDRLQDRKVVLMSTVFSQKEYGECLTEYKKRLGLSGDGDLFVLVNVSMSPFASIGNFERVLADAFREVAEEEVKTLVRRNTAVPAFHAFIIQGTEQLYFVHMPCFSRASQRYQCIMTGDITEVEKKQYLDAKAADPSATFIALTLRQGELSSIVEKRSFTAVISKLTPNGLQSFLECRIEQIDVVKERPLNSRFLDTAYPCAMPFYLYGTPDETHIDHMLLHAPNAQMTANHVALKMDNMKQADLADDLSRGVIAVADMLPERLLQPFTAQHPPTFFRPGTTFGVTVYRDRDAAQAHGPGLLDDDRLGSSAVIGRGTITLGDSVFVDASMLNVDTPVFPSHVPKRKDVQSLSQDHPFFQCHGPDTAGYAASGAAAGAASPSATSAGGWRDIWDEALAKRQFAVPPRQAVEDELQSCPSPVALRAPRFSFFP